VALPLLLAGPIVRRVEPRSVAVWVAFREAGTVNLFVWEGRQKSSSFASVESGDTQLATGAAVTRKLGENLHVALVSTALGFALDNFFRPLTPPLRPGAIYSYDVTFIPAEFGKPTQGLLEMGLLDDDPVGEGNTRHIEGVSEHAPKHKALGYKKGMLPSFVTPAASLKELRLAHASCRKTHGPGTDAMSWLDEVIEENLDKPTERIQQLFLTGDQIYADELPAVLLPMLHDLGVELMGGTEELPLDETRNETVTMATAPPFRRASLVRTDGGFTPVEAPNHLLTFGEYAAMYLAVWSPRVWRELLKEEKCYEHVSATSKFTLTKLESIFLREGEAVPSNLAHVVKERNTAEFKEEQQRLIVFAATVGKVARVLANASTYMIFDDHDITDDWNLNATWRNRVLSRPLGRAVLRNALLAYTFFQGWGSDWRSFDNRPEEGEPERPPTTNMKLMAAALEYLKTRTERSDEKAEEIDRLVGIKPGGTERAQFHYEVPGPLYQVRVVDTRTRRTYPYSVGVASPFLLGEEVTINEQLPKGPRRAGTEFVIVISATPVVGPEMLDRMLIPAIMQGFDATRTFMGEKSDFDGAGSTPGEHGSTFTMSVMRSRGAMFLDAETWPANERAQHEFLNRLAAYERVIVLSGEVHHGTNLSMSWYTTDRSAGAPVKKSARIVQFTSSAARNMIHKHIEPVYRGYHWMAQWMFNSTVDGFAWKDGAKLTLPADADLTLLRHSRMKDKPSLLPAYGWPDGTKITEGNEPDWSWRINAVRDFRPDSERTSPFKEVAEQLHHDMTEAQALPRGIERARAAAAIHQKAKTAQFAPLREVVFTNNVGIVTFDTEANGDIVAIHTLYSSEEKGFPEDEPEDELIEARPLGAGAHVSSGKPNTVVRTSLMQPVEGPPVPRKAVL
jgi:hypothetical protein